MCPFDERTRSGWARHFSDSLIDYLLNFDVDPCFELQVTTMRVAGTVRGQDAIDVARMGVVALDQVRKARFSSTAVPSAGMSGSAAAGVKKRSLRHRVGPVPWPEN